MPDTLIPQELAAIRGREKIWGRSYRVGSITRQVGDDRRALLAHIDALTAAVEREAFDADETGHKMSRPAVYLPTVLAILRGEH
jgi:hypothetical protein